MALIQSHYHSLSRRIVSYSCVFTLCICAIFSLISFALMYTLEDSFILKDIQLEANYLNDIYTKSGEWVQPRKATIHLHFSKQSFPDDIREQAIAEPRRQEFYGKQGRHYHVYTAPDKSNWYLVAEVSSDLLVRPIRTSVIQFLVISGITVTTMACLIAWLVASKTTRPLNRLAELVGSSSVETMPAQFAQGFPNNEIGMLATALEQSFNRIRSALNREKCFTHDVSHELRSPLAVINNAAELILIQKHIPQEQQAALQRITDAALQMQNTITSLLVLARESHVNTAKTHFELMPILERSVLDHCRLLEGKDVKIEISKACNRKLYLQTGMLKVLMDNLLSNAFQYTEKGYVKIDCTGSSLVVSDTGCGIDTQIIDNVTEPAVKSEQSTGFGFGLSIVKRLCEHQQWHLSIQSAKDIQGTKIEVSFN